MIWAEDDLVTQLKAGYYSETRSGRRGSRCSPRSPRTPRYDFTYAHRLLASRRDEVLGLLRTFLSSPSSSTAEPPELEKELRGTALKQDAEKP